MIKKLIALLLAVLMVASLFTACAKPEEPSEPSVDAEVGSSDKAEEKEDEKEPEELIELSIAYEEYANYPIDPEDSEYCQKLAEKFGVKINWLNWGADVDAYNEKLDLQMAAGSAPDIFMMHNVDAAKRYVEQDLLLCMEDYFADCPNLVKHLDNTEVRNATTYSEDGKLYSAVRMYSEPIYFFGLLVRDDLVAKTGYEYDGTIESFTELMRELKEETGSYVFTHRHGVENLVGFFGGTFGVPMSILGWSAEEQRYVWQGSNGRLYDELVWLNQLYEEGLLDPEYALNTTEMWEEKITTGQASMAIDYFVRCEQHTNAVRAEDPSSEYELGAIALPVTEDGFKPVTMAFASVDAQYQIGVNADTAYPELCMAIVDYLYSDESVDTYNYGKEGVTFNYVDGEPQYTEGVPTALNNFSPEGEALDLNEYRSNRIPIFQTVTDSDCYALTTYGQYSYDGYLIYKENEWLDEVAPVLPAGYTTFEEDAELADISTVLSEYYKAQLMDFIEGKRELTPDEFAKFQDECLNEYGAARWEEIMNNAYAAWQA